MEADLFVLCRCIDAAQRQSFRRMLAESTRPLLEEDADESERDIFNRLEATEFPAYLENVGDDSLFVHWWLGSRYDIDEIPPDIDALLAVGAAAAHALLFIDGSPQVLIAATAGRSTMHHYDESPVEGKAKPRGDDPGDLIEFLKQQ